MLAFRTTPSPSATDRADVPVLIDDVKHLGDGAFEMSRCTFFAVEASTALHDWVADLRARRVPFLLLGLAAVLYRPFGRRRRFTAPDQLAALFDAVEAVDGLVVETAHVWLPNFAVMAVLPRSLRRAPGAERGAVVRIRYPLFQHALRFAQDAADRDGFTAVCRELIEAAPLRAPAVRYSRGETRVFREWSRLQIREAAENYVRQRTDGRGVLDWRDEAGVARAG